MADVSAPSNVALASAKTNTNAARRVRSKVSKRCWKSSGALKDGCECLRSRRHGSAREKPANTRGEERSRERGSLLSKSYGKARRQSTINDVSRDRRTTQRKAGGWRRSESKVRASHAHEWSVSATGSFLFGQQTRFLTMWEF